MKTPSFRNKYIDRKAAEIAAETGEGPRRIWAEFDAQALQGNYHTIRARVPGQGILPMIKADAYGHGAEWAAQTLRGLPDLVGFGVATLDEGAEVRGALGPSGARTPIHVFSGASVWSAAAGEFCERYGLTPVISTEEGWRAFQKGGWTERVPYEIKFNTGMNRLGVPVAMLSTILRELRDLPARQHPVGIMTHLAMGEKPEANLSQRQQARFREIRAACIGVLPQARFHFANSAAIWNESRWDLQALGDCVRPGLALYGVPPWGEAPARGLAAVMTLRVQVLSTRVLRAGESVGYGGRFKASEPTRIAVLGAGYADGLPRSLSGKGQVRLAGRDCRLLGTISMDLCAVECPKGVRVGDAAEIIGPEIDPWRQAEAGGTIPYELLTSLSKRVTRIYERTRRRQT